MSSLSRGPATPVRLTAEAARAAASLPALVLEAERVAETVAQGLHPRRQPGSGDAFWNFRPFQFGDPPRAIDWRQTAKTDTVLVREVEVERAQTAMVWVDLSASMHYRSDKGLAPKAWRAAVLALALADLAHRGGERIGVIGMAARPASGRAAFRRVCEHLSARLDDSLAGTAPDAAALPNASQVESLPAGSDLFLIGDFLDPADTVLAALRGLDHRRARLHLMQVLDPAEAALPFTGRVRFKGFERGDGPAFLVPRVEPMRDAYHAALAELQDRLAAFCGSRGWLYHRHVTDRPASDLILRAHAGLAHHGGRP